MSTRMLMRLEGVASEPLRVRDVLVATLPSQLRPDIVLTQMKAWISNNIVAIKMDSARVAKIMFRYLRAEVACFRAASEQNLLFEGKWLRTKLTNKLKPLGQYVYNVIDIAEDMESYHLFLFHDMNANLVAIHPIAAQYAIQRWPNLQWYTTAGGAVVQGRDKEDKPCIVIMAFNIENFAGEIYRQLHAKGLIDSQCQAVRKWIEWSA
ncbi:MAG: hypothetical protein DRH04_01900 [Deltaproteobacteria bacterium]|nr:MAG: hypothetical protein DRH04_01900 [Deltaproteobacteria bacterium]